MLLIFIEYHFATFLAVFGLRLIWTVTLQIHYYPMAQRLQGFRDISD